MTDWDFVVRFMQDECILSGCRPQSILATIDYLRRWDSGSLLNMSQRSICERHGISTVCLRNNVRKVKASKHYKKIMGMLR
jgi:hypothetical protein